MHDWLDARLMRTESTNILDALKARPELGCHMVDMYCNDLGSTYTTTSSMQLAKDMTQHGGVDKAGSTALQSSSARTQLYVSVQARAA